MDRSRKLERLPIVEGSSPLRLLPDRSILSKLESLPKSGGIDPTNLLWRKDKCFKLVKFPNSGASSLLS